MIIVKSWKGVRKQKNVFKNLIIDNILFQFYKIIIT